MNISALKSKALSSPLHRTVYVMQCQASQSQKTIEHYREAIEAGKYHQTHSPRLSMVLDDIKKYSGVAEANLLSQQEYARRALKALETAEERGQGTIEQSTELLEILGNFEKDARAFERACGRLRAAWPVAQAMMNEQALVPEEATCP